MIVEYTYSESDLRKRCFGCVYLKMKDDWYGFCENQNTKVKSKYRIVTGKSCVWKKEQEAKQG